MSGNLKRQHHYALPDALSDKGTLPDPIVVEPGKVVVAFDCSGTLRKWPTDEDDPFIPVEPVRKLLIILSRFQNVHIHVWSGRGLDYVNDVVNRMGLAPYIDSRSGKLQETMGMGIKAQAVPPGVPVPDICIDNIPATELGTFNLIFPSLDTH